MTDPAARRADPIGVFNFELVFTDDSLPAGGGDDPKIAGGFSECTGLEGTMEPKVIKVGGRNDGPAQRVGPVTWATVVLKRGVGTGNELFEWFSRSLRGKALGTRATVSIRVKSHARDGAGGEARTVRTWRLLRALPVKFKTADLNARSGEIGIEELHLAHEGLELDLSGAVP